MWTFASGLVIGCFVGAIGALSVLLFANAIPDGFPHFQKNRLPAWQFSLIVSFLMLLSTLVYLFLKPHRVTFLALLLFFLVMVTAKLRGALAAIFTLTLAAVVMSYILPPANTILIGSVKDRWLLAAFVGFGIVASRLIGRRQEIS